MSKTHAPGMPRRHFLVAAAAGALSRLEGGAVETAPFRARAVDRAGSTGCPNRSMG